MVKPEWFKFMMRDRDIYIYIYKERERDRERETYRQTEMDGEGEIVEKSERHVFAAVTASPAISCVK